MKLNCVACNGEAALIYSNIRVMRFFCKPCQLIFRVTVHGKYHPDKALVLVDSPNKKSFKLREKKTAQAGEVLQTVIQN